MRIICAGIWFFFPAFTLGEDRALSQPLPPNFAIVGTYERHANVVCTYNSHGSFRLKGETIEDIGAIKPILEKCSKKDLIVVIIAKTPKTDTELKNVGGFIAEQFHSIGFQRVVVRRASAGIDAWILLDSTREPKA